jgi:molecular chaperone GrpE
MTDPTDVETLLDRFRQWLQEARAQGEQEQDQGGETLDLEPAGTEVGLYRLVEEFTALRHEVKLQTKSARGLQEETEALLPAFRQAIEQFRAVAPREEQAAQAVGRPLAEALADLDEALDRGRAEIEKARQRLADASIVPHLEAFHARQPWYRRLLHRGYRARVRALVERRERETLPPLLDALLEGYGLIQSRLRRSMDAEQLRRIDAPGRPVDPDVMTVVEVVDAPGLTPGLVVDEVRRGYTWRGRVLRFVEVRAARGRSTLDSSSDGTEP